MEPVFLRFNANIFGSYPESDHSIERIKTKEELVKFLVRSTYPLPMTVGM